MLVQLGCVAFLLFFLGDCNDWKWDRALLRLCFPAGALLLCAVTIRMALAAKPAFPFAVRCFFYFLAAVFLLLEVDALFFALDPREAYARQGESRAVRTDGVYALCRHPGVLWLLGLYICLWIAAGLPLYAAAAFNGLNALLVWFEDEKVFPARLEGYDDYRRTTPFLIPTPKSIRMCRMSL